MVYYFLLKYNLYSSIGGAEEDLDIEKIAYDKNDLIKYMQDILDDNEIELINDIPFDEFEFDKDENSWKIIYNVDGMTISRESLYTIVERECE